MKTQSKRIAAKLINIDCDLHAGALEALRWSEKFMAPDTILYMEDYFSTFLHGHKKWGTAKAFKIFEEESTFSFEKFVKVGSWGQAFFVHKEW